LESTIEGCRPLFNLFIVATHAAPSQISDSALEQMLDDASARIHPLLRDSVLESRAISIGMPVDADAFRERFYSFYLEDSGRRRKLEDGLRGLLIEDLPTAWSDKADREICGFKEAAKSHWTNVIEMYEKILEDLDAADRELKRAASSEEDRKIRIEKKRINIESKIVEYRREAIKGLHHDYADIIDAKAIESDIHMRGWNRKEAQQHIVNIAQENLRHRTESRISSLSERLARDIDDFLDDYMEAALSLKSPSFNAAIPFNAKGAFLGGLTGAAAIGALAAWAAALGNLGAYIIAAKAVSLLSALGISISGGSAAVMSFIATIGGPITIAVGIVALLAVLGLAIFGDSWQKRLAKKVVSACQDAGVKDTFQEGIGEFWDATLDSFRHGADEVETMWRNYLKDLRSVLNDKDGGIDRLTQRLENARAARDFFGGILRPVSD